MQKTRGPDVAPVWAALIERYPTPNALAVADPFKVEALVARLGLRAQRTSRLQLMAAEWANDGYRGDLPGLGAYGSAIVGLSLGRRPAAPPVDGNVSRVVSRVLDLSFERGEPRKKPEVREAIADLLGGRPPRRQLAVLYAVVDLGAKLCTPRAPDCGRCPIAPECRGKPC